MTGRRHESRAQPQEGIGRWFLALVSGVYAGIAEEARAEAYKAIAKRRAAACSREREGLWRR
jgi:hypothetical protein